MSTLNQIPPQYLDYLTSQIEAIKRKSPHVVHPPLGYPPDAALRVSDQLAYTDVRLSRPPSTTPTFQAQTLQFPKLTNVARLSGTKVVNVAGTPITGSLGTFQKQIYQAASNLGTTIANQNRSRLPSLVTLPDEMAVAVSNLVSSMSQRSTS